MAVPVQLVVIGVAAGAVYALLALAVVVVHRSTRVLDLSAAGSGALGVYVLYELMRGSAGGAGRFLAAACAAVLVAAVLGAAVERFVIRPARAVGGVVPLAATVATFALAASLVSLRYGTAGLPVPNPFPRSPSPIGTVDGTPIFVTGHGLLTIAVGALIGGAFLLAARKPDRLAGVSSTAVWAFAAGAAAVACILFATGTVLSPLGLASLVTKALVVAALAGFSSVPRCLAGGPLLGVAEALATRTGVPGADQSVAFFALVVILLLPTRHLDSDAARAAGTRPGHG